MSFFTPASIRARKYRKRKWDEREDRELKQYLIDTSTTSGKI